MVMVYLTFCIKYKKRGVIFNFKYLKGAEYTIFIYFTVKLSVFVNLEMWFVFVLLLVVVDKTSLFFL